MAEVSWSAWSRYGRVIESEWIGCPGCGGATRWFPRGCRGSWGESDWLLWLLLVVRFLCLCRLEEGVAASSWELERVEDGLV